MKNEAAARARIELDLSKLVAVAPTLKHANGAGRIFELYLMMRLARKLKDAGWSVNPVDHAGNSIAGGVFIQRGGAPTGIFPAALAVGPSSIQIRPPGRSGIYEIVNGVQFQGRSGALHEVDIAVIPGSIVAALRSGTQVECPVGRPCIAIECKDVGSNGSSDEMRSVVARMYDLTILNSHLPYVFGGGLPAGHIFARAPSSPWAAHGTSAQTYLAANKGLLCALARRSGITSGAYRMTGLFHIHTYTEVDRGTQSAVDLVDDLVMWMESNLS